VLLVTEDLDELFELADRIAIIFESKIVYETTLASADRSYRSSPGRSCRQALEFVRPCLKIWIEKGVLSSSRISDSDIPDNWYDVCGGRVDGVILRLFQLFSPCRIAR
jgi:ABC-type multidrug transport system ATPase subunit